MVPRAWAREQRIQWMETRRLMNPHPTHTPASTSRVEELTFPPNGRRPNSPSCSDVPFRTCAEPHALALLSRASSLRFFGGGIGGCPPGFRRQKLSQKGLRVLGTEVVEALLGWEGWREACWRTEVLRSESGEEEGAEMRSARDEEEDK